MGDGMEHDLAIAGGGLAGSLIALALAARRPDLSVLLVESGETIGGNHIWPFLESDVPPEHRWLIEPLIGHSWPGYFVLFPKLRRRVRTPCHALLSERLGEAVRAALPPERILTGRRALSVGRMGLTLEDGTRIEAKAVIDARGPATLSLLDLGWRKSLAQVVRTDAPHGLDRPVLVDATVRQHDGYRFVNVLPLGTDRLRIEDVYYSDGAALERGLLARRVEDYAAARGWAIAAVESEEAGALLVVQGGQFERYWQSGGNGVAKAGVRAGLVHPLTGDALPDAVRLAVLVAELDAPAAYALHKTLYDWTAAAWRGRGFYRHVSRLLFRAGPARQRYRVMQRLHGLETPVVERFHAARSTRADRLHMLAGRPLAPASRTLALWREKRR